MGVIRMALDFVYMFDAPKCWETEDTRPAIVAKVFIMIMVRPGGKRTAAVLSRLYLMDRGKRI